MMTTPSSSSPSSPTRGKAARSSRTGSSALADRSGSTQPGLNWPHAAPILCKASRGREIPMVEIDEIEFEREVLAAPAEVAVLVDFWAPWCGPCRALGPLLERLADESAGGVVLAKGKTDEKPNPAREVGGGG